MTPSAPIKSQAQYDTDPGVLSNPQQSAITTAKTNGETDNAPTSCTPYGEYEKGYNYEYGLAGLSKDPQKALDWYRKAILDGYTGAEDALLRLQPKDVIDTARTPSTPYGEYERGYDYEYGLGE